MRIGASAVGVGNQTCGVPGSPPGSVERELLMVDFRGGGLCLALGEQVEAEPTLLGYWPYSSWRPPRLNRTQRGARGIPETSAVSDRPRKIGLCTPRFLLDDWGVPVDMGEVIIGETCLG